MTKQELKTQLKNSGFELKPEKEIGKDGSYTKYEIQTTFTEGNVLKSDKIRIAVDTSGNTYYVDKHPVFERDIKNYLQEEKEKGNILGSFINLMNSMQEVAEVNLLEETEEGVIRNRFVLTRNSSGNIQRKKYN